MKKKLTIEKKRADLLKSLEEIRKQKIEAVKEQNWQKACDLRSKEVDILDMIKTQDESTGS